MTQTIAIIGVSANPDKYGYKIFKDLLHTKNVIYGINPKQSQILNQQLYVSLDSLPSTPDLVITVVPPQITENIVKDCIRLNIKKIWMQPGSQSQIAIQNAKNNNIEVIANACYMKQAKIW